MVSSPEPEVETKLAEETTVRVTEVPMIKEVTTTVNQAAAVIEEATTKGADEDTEAATEVVTLTKKSEDDPEEEEEEPMEDVIVSAPITTTMSPTIIDDMSSSPAVSVLQLMEGGAKALDDDDVADGIDETDTNIGDGIDDGTETEVTEADDALAADPDVIDDVAEKEVEVEADETPLEDADVETVLSDESTLNEKAPLEVALTIKEVVSSNDLTTDDQMAAQDVVVTSEGTTDGASEIMTAMEAIEDPSTVEVAAIVDLHRSTSSSEDQTPVEIVMATETTTDNASEGMTAKEATKEAISAEVASLDEMTTDDGMTAMEEESTIEDPTPVQVGAEGPAIEESASSSELPSDDQTPVEIAASTETTTDDALDEITAIEIIGEIFASPEEKEAVPVQTDAQVP